MLMMLIPLRSLSPSPCVLVGRVSCMYIPGYVGDMEHARSMDRQPSHMNVTYENHMQAIRQ
jgi:hypothetical protein